MRVRDDIESKQIPILSADLTAAILRLHDRAVLIVSVYVEGVKAQASKEAVENIKNAVRETRNRIRTTTDIIFAGDFNRHDQLWGGDDISVARQGESDPIIDLMEEYGLCSLLPRGTKTWSNSKEESTIDLMLASEDSATTTMQAPCHGTRLGP